MSIPADHQPIAVMLDFVNPERAAGTAVAPPATEGTVR